MCNFSVDVIAYRPTYLKISATKADLPYHVFCRIANADVYHAVGYIETERTFIIDKDVIAMILCRTPSLQNCSQIILYYLDKLGVQSSSISRSSRDRLWASQGCCSRLNDSSDPCGL